MNWRTTGLQLTLSTIDCELDRLRYEVMGAAKALEEGDTLVTQKINLEAIAKHAGRIQAIANSEASSLAEHLNRYAVAAE